MSIQDLKKEAKELKIKGYTKMDTAALTEAISTAKVENTRKHLEMEQAAKVENTRKHLETPIADAVANDVSSFMSGRKFIGAGITFVLFVVTGVLYYLTRPEPTMWEKLMGYLPF